MIELIKSLIRRVVKKEKIIYSGTMDKECIDLCNTLNNLDGIRTTESCCGHFRDPYRIFLKCINVNSISTIARALDRRYSGTTKLYKFYVITADRGYPLLNYVIESDGPYNSQEDMDVDIKQIIKNIERYKNYFKHDRR